MTKLFEWIQDPLILPSDFLKNPSFPKESSVPTYRCLETGKILELREGMEIFTKEDGTISTEGLDLKQQIEAMYLARKENRYHFKKWKIETRESNPGMCHCCNHQKFLVMVDENKKERSLGRGFIREVIFTEA